MVFLACLCVVVRQEHLLLEHQAHALISYGPSCVSHRCKNILRIQIVTSNCDLYSCNAYIRTWAMCKLHPNHVHAHLVICIGSHDNVNAMTICNFLESRMNFDAYLGGNRELHKTECMYAPRHTQHHLRIHWHVFIFLIAFCRYSSSSHACTMWTVIP